MARSSVTLKRLCHLGKSKTKYVVYRKQFAHTMFMYRVFLHLVLIALVGVKSSLELMLSVDYPTLCK